MSARASTATGSLCEELRAGSEPIWASLHAHPFIRELAAGTLPLEKFRFYLEQNLLYLPEYARVIALGAARSTDVEELARFSLALSNIVDNEIPKDRELLAQVIELGAEPRGGSVAVAPGTLAYSAYLLATAYGAGPLEIMTAIMPCAWSYGEIASRLRGEVRPHPVYSSWVGFFDSEEYRELIADMRAQLDAMGAGADPARQARLREIFDMSGRLERGFWDMSYEMTQWPDVSPSESR